MLAYPSKKFFLFLSKNKLMNKAAKKWGLKFGASQVVAGETIETAITKIKELNQMGFACTIDHLGEFVNDPTEAKRAMETCIRILEKLSESSVDCNLSLKLTQLGLDVNEELCLENMRKIVKTAANYNNFVRIDMEDYAHCQQTLSILDELRKDHDNVSTVIQAYLFRSEQDLEKLKGHPLRLVKGAYNESTKVAYQSKEDINRNFIKLIKKHLKNGSYTAIATHDHLIIEKVKKYAQICKIENSQFEFQFLYGFRISLQQQLVNEGYKVRVYVPFGKDWFGYFMRRLAERPQNISFAVKGFIKK